MFDQDGQNLLRKVARDEQKVKEKLQTVCRSLWAMDNPEALNSVEKLIEAHEDLVQSQIDIKVAMQEGLPTADAFVKEGASGQLDKESKDKLERVRREIKKKEKDMTENKKVELFSRKRRFQPDKTNQICYKCGEVGHYASDSCCTLFQPGGRGFQNTQYAGQHQQYPATNQNQQYPGTNFNYY